MVFKAPRKQNEIIHGQKERVSYDVANAYRSIPG